MKNDIVMKCEDCGYKPTSNKEKSNKNWDYYDTTCPKCGGFVGPVFEGDSK